MIWKAASAERSAGRELTLPYRSAHQQKIGDVGAGDEKNKTDGAEQDQQRLPCVADDKILQRGYRETILRAESAGVFAAKLIDSELQLRVGLLQGDARLEPRCSGKVVGHILRIEIELEGHPKICRCIGDEVVANDADYQIRLAVDLDRPADDIGLPTEAALPQAVTQHDDAAAVGTVFCSGEGTSGDYRCTEHRKVICGYMDALYL